MNAILLMAWTVFLPLPVCGERIEVRGLIHFMKNPYPTLSLSKGETTQRRAR
jgi:hypothetical protein